MSLNLLVIKCLKTLFYWTFELSVSQDFLTSVFLTISTQAYMFDIQILFRYLRTHFRNFHQLLKNIAIRGNTRQIIVLDIVMSYSTTESYHWRHSGPKTRPNLKDNFYVYTKEVLKLFWVLLRNMCDYVNKDEIWPLFSCNCINFTNDMSGGWIRSRNRINICAVSSSGVRSASGVASASASGDRSTSGVASVSGKVIRFRPGSDQSNSSGSDRIRIGSTTGKEGKKFTNWIFTCVPLVSLCSTCQREKV